MTDTVYRIDGMNCAHCVRSVTAALTGLPGVVGVSVDLTRGRVSVSSGSPLQSAAVREAVDAAGFTLLD